MFHSLRLIDTLSFATACLVSLAVLIPGVQAAREDARQSQCRWNLVELGIAFQEYESSQGGFPPRRTGFNNGEPYGGWGGAVLAYLDEVVPTQPYDIRYDFFDPVNRAVTETQIPVMLCPASSPGRTIEIQSQVTTKSLNDDKDTVYTCHAAATDFTVSNGVLITQRGYGMTAFPRGSGIGNQRQPTTDNAVLPLWKITDGLSNTLLMIEQAGRPNVWRNRENRANASQFGLSPNARGAWAGWGSIGFGAVDRDTGERPGRGDATDCSVNCNNWFGMYSFHSGGANALFCDGSVRFVGTSLDPLTFAYLTVRDDGFLIEQGTFE